MHAFLAVNRECCRIFIIGLGLARFLRRDAMHNRGLCRGWVSVRSSVTFVYCVETAKVTAIVTVECE